MKVRSTEAIFQFQAEHLREGNIVEVLFIRNVATHDRLVSFVYAAAHAMLSVAGRAR
jgi:hypothetical protein